MKGAGEWRQSAQVCYDWTSLQSGVQCSALSGSDWVVSESLRGTTVVEFWLWMQEQPRAQVESEQEAEAAAPSGGRTPRGLPGRHPNRRNHPGPQRAAGAALRYYHSVVMPSQAASSPEGDAERRRMKAASEPGKRSVQQQRQSAFHSSL